MNKKINDSIDKPREVKKLLSSATIELRAASINFFSTRQLLEGSVFHCQNSIEKSFMAFLIFKGVKFEKSDDFQKLAEYSAAEDSDFNDICAQVLNLRPHPRNASFKTDIEEVKSVIITAEKVFQIVIEKMPLEYFKR
jgi:HEPN domain-containing protein